MNRVWKCLTIYFFCTSQYSAELTIVHPQFALATINVTMIDPSIDVQWQPLVVCYDKTLPKYLSHVKLCEGLFWCALYYILDDDEFLAFAYIFPLCDAFFAIGMILMSFRSWKWWHSLMAP